MNLGELKLGQTLIIAEPVKDGLPEKMVMLDCEMSGTRPKEDIVLMIALTMLLRQEDNTYKEDPNKEPCVIYIKTDKKPTRKFDKQFLTHIYEICNSDKAVTKEQAKQMIIDWLGDDKGKLQPCGDCVPFDVMFLAFNDIIEPNYYDEDDNAVPGTFHYEYFDMNAPKQILNSKMKKKVNLKTHPDYDHEGVHDALVDDRNQLLELNELIKGLL